MGWWATRRRIRTLGWRSLFSRQDARRSPAIFLDLGLHRTALQTRKVLAWFPNATVHGFEANPEYFEDCRKLFAGDGRVHLVNAAVVGPDAQKTVTLHLDGKRGLGDSIFAARGGSSSIEVPAVRLSEFMRRHGLDTTDAAIVLRMNIEGAELHVLRDLADSGMIGRIAGWYGRWNDCAKVSAELDRELRGLIAAHGIENFTFNDRDSLTRFARLKEWAIRYDLATSIAAAQLCAPRLSQS